MPTNSSAAYYLDFNPVPEDRECASTVTEFLQAMKDFGFVAGLASSVLGGATPSTNNQTAALQAEVNTLKERVSELESQIPDRRVAAVDVALAAGDSVQALTWAPAFETTKYEVRVTLKGASSHPSAYYGWRVVSGTNTLTGVQLVFDNIPANATFSAVVETLE